VEERSGVRWFEANLLAVSLVAELGHSDAVPLPGRFFSGCMDLLAGSDFGGDRRLGGTRVREAGGVFDHVVPAFVGVREGVFFLGHGQRVEHDLAEVGQGRSGASGDAVLGQSSEDFAHDVVDVGGGEEIAGVGGSDLCAKVVGFQELLLIASMEGAEGGVIDLAEHAAAAVVGEGVLAEFGVIGARIGHCRSPF